MDLLPVQSIPQPSLDLQQEQEQQQEGIEPSSLSVSFSALPLSQSPSSSPSSQQQQQQQQREKSPYGTSHSISSSPIASPGSGSDSGDLLASFQQTKLDASPLASPPLYSLQPRLKRAESISSRTASLSFPTSELHSPSGPDYHVTRKVNSEDGLQRECEAYSQHINSLVASYQDQLARYLPVHAANLFSSLQDGIVLACMIHAVRPELIDLKALTFNLDLSQLKQLQSKTIFEVTNNHNIVLKAARATGIKIVNIGSEDILSMNPSLVLGLVWQLVRLQLLGQVNLHSHPELIKLVQPNETIADLIHLSSEAILLRWFNYHLARANAPKLITNLSKDLSDSVAYAHLFMQIMPAQELASDFLAHTLAEPIPNASDASPEVEKAKEARAKLILEQVKKVGINTFVSARDIVHGHARLNLCLVADLFNRFVGIQMMSDEEIKALVDERDVLRRRVKALELELEKQASGYEHESSAWESILSEERAAYGQKFEELRSFYEGQAEEWKRKYIVDTESQSKKISHLKSIHEATMQHVAEDLKGLLSLINELVLSTTTSADYFESQNNLSDSSQCSESRASVDAVANLSQVLKADDDEALGTSSFDITDYPGAEDTADAAALHHLIVKLSKQLSNVIHLRSFLDKDLLQTRAQLAHQKQLGELMATKVRELAEAKLNKKTKKPSWKQRIMN